MHRGYVKLWRKTLDSGILKNPELFLFWAWCLMKATHKPCKTLVGFQEIELNPGQFIFGRNKAAVELRLTPMKVRTCVQSLSNMKNITIKSTNKFSIITIANWECYQSEQNEINQQVSQQLTSKQPANNQQLTTNKNDKNNKNEKNDKNKTYIGPNGPGSVLKTYQYPDWLDKDLWSKFHQMRSRIKKPITTEQTITNLINRLKKNIDAGHSQEEIIQAAIDGCWQSFYPPKQDQPNRGMSKAQLRMQNNMAAMDQAKIILFGRNQDESGSI